MKWVVLGVAGAFLIAMIWLSRRRTTDAGGDISIGDYINQYGDPGYLSTDPRQAQTGGLNTKSWCQQIYGYNSQVAAQVPDKSAKYVSQAGNMIGQVNCGAMAIAEKAVSATIVTPAKKAYSFVKGLF